MIKLLKKAKNLIKGKSQPPTFVNSTRKDEATSGDAIRRLSSYYANTDVLTPKPELEVYDKGALYTDLQKQYKNSVIDFYKNVDQKTISHAAAGSIKLFDALGLAAAIDVAKPKRILEVGSYLGFSSRWILECSARHDSHVTSIDPGVRHRVFDHISQHLRSFNKQFMDSGRFDVKNAFFGLKDTRGMEYDYTHYEPKKTPAEIKEIFDSVPLMDSSEEKFDFVFIDGDHSYESTLNNIKLASTMLNSPGCIVVHDAITWPDVHPAAQKASEELEGQLEYIGITGARVHEFFSEWFSCFDRDVADKPVLQYALCDGLALIYKR